jgi:hypothetical protein
MMRTKTRSIVIIASLVMLAAGVPVNFRGFCQEPPPPPGDVFSCRLERSASGAFRLILGGFFREGSTVSVGGTIPRKVKLRDPIPASNEFFTMILKGRICNGLPGNIVVTRPNGPPAPPFFCVERCPN